MKRASGVVPAVAVLAVMGLALGCDPEREAEALKAKASAEAERVADKVKTEAEGKARSAASAAASAAERGLDEGLSLAKRELFGLTQSGALSDAAKATLESAASADRAAKFAAEGAVLLPVALQLGAVLNRAVDDETAIEPIYQKIPEGKQAELDASIKAMPKVEVIDGVSVGYRRVDGLDLTSVKKEQTALVLWRRGDHLVGFVYRSKRTIDLAVLAQELPALVKAANRAAAG